jgi:hypothetical protein
MPVDATAPAAIILCGVFVGDEPTPTSALVDEIVLAECLAESLIIESSIGLAAPSQRCTLHGRNNTHERIHRSTNSDADHQ